MIPRHAAKTFYVGLFTAFYFLPVVPALGEHETYQEVAGVAIHIGIMPVEMIRKYQSADDATSRMHGGIPPGAHRDHLVVALFDSDTGKRIADAKVTATMAEIGLTGETNLGQLLLPAESRSVSRGRQDSPPGCAGNDRGPVHASAPEEMKNAALAL